ncbi:MYXO-CTERM domain-containing protein [Nannocystis exedens]|uniref:MYXO-CTERM domain-containing protein n=1 Tax=Nannocystis exedens TaxID=54 RepID=A0A1I2HYL7_9BACT|nr:MYXO-CTERM sorting domain-containing protein [Nannocystis exedens]PCC67028.1 hypothetical protein NAEX_00031 [Nannocystis exedens]SFF35002.1 MYXO-CTERM domain-containing protein [Nannocystis exedens]
MSLSRLLNLSAARWSAALSFVLVATTSGPARADAVSEPPSCPEGTSPNGCHGGEYCEPNECVDTCPSGKVCMEVERCAGTVTCGGGWTSTGGDFSVDNVLGPCGEGGACAVGTCKSFKLCVSDTTGATSTGEGSDTSQGSESDSASGGTPPKKEGCEGCRTSDDAAPALLALGVLGLAIRRRSRRRG